jgi:hypothetical protein
VGVTVDESGKTGLVAQIEDCRPGDIAGPGLHLADPLSLHDDRDGPHNIYETDNG